MIRRYAPGRLACANALTIFRSPNRMPSFEHGWRGWQTSNSTVPTRQRSPISAPVTSTPSSVRFSPNIPSATSTPSTSSHQSESSRAYA